MPAATSQPISVRIGLVLFAIGLVFLAVTVLPFFLGEHDRSLWLNLGCLGVPIGFVLAVSGVVRAGRAEQRAAAAEVDRLSER